MDSGLPEGDTLHAATEVTTPYVGRIGLTLGWRGVGNARAAGGCNCCQVWTRHSAPAAPAFTRPYLTGEWGGGWGGNIRVMLCWICPRTIETSEVLCTIPTWSHVHQQYRCTFPSGRLRTERGRGGGGEVLRHRGGGASPPWKWQWHCRAREPQETNGHIDWLPWHTTAYQSEPKKEFDDDDDDEDENDPAKLEGAIDASSSLSRILPTHHHQSYILIRLLFQSNSFHGPLPQRPQAQKPQRSNSLIIIMTHFLKVRTSQRHHLRN